YLWFEWHLTCPCVL
ncbi:putative membrane protein, partial [Vibrio parahaemolyticus V-223/04]